MAEPTTDDRLDFSGRVVLVTGGTRGVGRGIAEAFLSAGAEVVVCGRNTPDELPAAGDRAAVFVAGDIRQPEQAAQVVEQTATRLGRLDVLVNNAGGSPAADAATVSPRFVTSVVTLNLLAPFWCAQAANAVMQQQADGGAVVNIGSVSGVRPSPGTAAYGAAKAGLVNLTKTLAMEWAPKVRVNCVVVGLLGTEAAADFYGSHQAVEAVTATVPAGRLGTAADVAGVCLFLASPLAAFVSGASVEAHGGGERPPYLAALEDLGPGADPT